MVTRKSGVKKVAAKKSTRRKKTATRAGTATRNPARARKRKAPEQTGEAVTAVSFSPGLTIRNVTAKRSELSQALENKSGVQMDLSAVEVVDTAAMQLLLAFNLEAKKRGVPLHWQHPSEAVCAAGELLGLTNELELSK